MAGPKVIVPEDEIDRLEIDLDTGECVVYWKRRRRQTGIAVEFIYGPQGTYVRIALDDEPDKTLVIGQSGKMQPVCYFHDEPPIIPEDPPIIISEEELTGTWVISQE